MFLVGLCLIALLVSASPAHAGFLVPILFGAAFAATAVGVGITIAANVALSIGLSYVATKLLAKKQQQPAKEASAPTPQAGGVQLNLRVAADVPQSLIVGTAVTAGSLVYAKTFGTRGEIDNSDLVEVIALADHPCTELVAVLNDGAAVTLGADDGYRGRVISGFDGKLAIKFFDGTQVAADQFTVDALAGADNQPWTSAFIGTGTTYVRAHSIYDREKVPGQMRWRFVVKGIKLYDPRLDTTVGGSGSHRWGQLNTHEWTDNVAVIVYNILRGIYVGPNHFYGLTRTTAAQLPLAEWFAAMNECDVAVTLDVGGTEPQFRAGGEISVNTEPLAVIKELLKTCGGRLVENGGVYKLFIGAPGLPSLVFTDEHLLADREDSFKPILPLESRINYITGTYTAPTDNWLPKVAPPRQSATWITEDRQRLPADLSAPMIQSGTQMQRVMQNLLLRARRERRHICHFPPPVFAIEPGDVVEWDSERNGYEAKLFEVEEATYDGAFNVTLALTEIDPSDYDWTTDDEKSEVDGTLLSVRPAPKIVGGFAAESFLYRGDLGTQRSAIRLSWDDPEDGDISGVEYELRRAAIFADVASGQFGDDVVEALQLVILGNLQPLTEYEVRARFVSANNYERAWSLWLPVTTLDDRFAFADLSLEIQAILGQYQAETRRFIQASDNRLAEMVAKLAAADTLDKEAVTRDLRRTQGQVTASYREAITVATGPTSALARKDEELEAAIVIGDDAVIAGYTQEIAVLSTVVQEGDFQNAEAIASVDTRLTADVNEHSAQLRTRFVVGATPSGAIASYELQATAEQASAGMRVVAIQSGTARTGYIYMDADRFMVGKTGIAGFNPIFIVDTANNRIILNADIIANGTITANKLNVTSLSAISANFGNATFSGVARGSGDRLVIDFNSATIDLFE